MHLLWMYACLCLLSLWSGPGGTGIRTSRATSVTEVIPESTLYPLRVALTIDENSAKDVLVISQSILSSAYNASNIYFHIVVCANEVAAADDLRLRVMTAFDTCLPYSKYEIKPFVLPTTSGFAMQAKSVTRRSHWYSPTGADMARFFLASLFPDVERLLYLDNDIIVSCCLEALWATDMGEDKIAGIALDDLKWATVTQFQRQYNASHPLVIKNMRRTKSSKTLTRPSGEVDLTSPVTEDEFWKALPRYPNDGVLLINVPRWNKAGILQEMEEIATANAKGEYVVGLGTQQFTVLLLYDRWVELTPRANLRHFPDMARGYLMWFFYNGVIHFAGQSKPRTVCNNQFTDNEHRLHTYTAWATSMYELTQQCPSEPLIEESTKCANNVPQPTSFLHFMSIMQLFSVIQTDQSNQFVHIGSMQSSASLAQPVSADVSFPPVLRTMSESSPSSSVSAAGSSGDEQSTVGSAEEDDVHSVVRLHTPNSKSVCDSGDPKRVTLSDYAKVDNTVQSRLYTKTNFAELDKKLSKIGGDRSIAHVASGTESINLMQLVHRFVLHDSAWSFKVIDGDEQRLLERSYPTLNHAMGQTACAFVNTTYQKIMSDYMLTLQGGRSDMQADNTLASRVAKAHTRVSSKQREGKRQYTLSYVDICDGSTDFPGIKSSTSGSGSAAYHVDKNGKVIEHSSNSAHCDNFVPSFARMHNKNILWDKKMPISKPPCESVLQQIKKTGQHFDVIGLSIDHQPTVRRPYASSLGVLRNLDLVFMRPKVIMIRIGSPQYQQFIIKKHLMSSGSSKNVNDMELHLNISADFVSGSEAGVGGASASSLFSGKQTGVKQPHDVCKDHRGSQRTLGRDVDEAVEILRRNGYMAYVDRENMCGDTNAGSASGTQHDKASGSGSTHTPHHHLNNRKLQSADTNPQDGSQHAGKSGKRGHGFVGKQKPSSASRRKGQHSHHSHYGSHGNIQSRPSYVCIWGTRTNTIELGQMLENVK